MRKLSQVLFIAFLPIFLFAQNTVSGTVTDASTGEALAGANVVVTGTSMGAAATADGSYSISNVPAGSYTITASVIGYADGSQSVNVSGDATINFSLSVSALELSAVEILASRASDNTPVAYTNITKAEVEACLITKTDINPFFVTMKRELKKELLKWVLNYHFLLVKLTVTTKLKSELWKLV